MTTPTSSLTTQEYPAGWPHNARLSGVDWNALGANPRVVVTSTYGLGAAAVTTVVGPSYTFPLTAVSHPMLTRGTGTVADPFLVGTPTEVWNMGCNADSYKHFRFDNARVEGRRRVGVVVAMADQAMGIRRVSVTASEVTGQDGTGLFAGEAEDIQITGSSTNDSTVWGRPNAYTGAVGDTVAIDAIGSNGVREVGGLIGEADDNLLISDVVLDHTVNVVADGQVTNGQVGLIGGLAGDWDAEDGLVTRVTGSVTVDITARDMGTGTNGVGGLFGGMGLEQSSFTRSTLHVEVVVRAPATADPVTFQDIGAVVGQSGVAHYDTLTITGSVTIDARLATGDVGGVAASEPGSGDRVGWAGCGE